MNGFNLLLVYFLLDLSNFVSHMLLKHLNDHYQLCLGLVTIAFHANESQLYASLLEQFLVERLAIGFKLSY